MKTLAAQIALLGLLGVGVAPAALHAQDRYGPYERQHDRCERERGYGPRYEPRYESYDYGPRGGYAGYDSYPGYSARYDDRSYRPSAGRSAAIIGGSAAAGALIGGAAGRGQGAAIGAVIGGITGIIVDQAAGDIATTDGVKARASFAREIS